MLHTFPAPADHKPLTLATRHYESITRIFVGNDNYLSISVKGNFHIIHGCTVTAYARSQYPLSDDRTKAMLQVALTALETGNKVLVRTLGCTSTVPEGDMHKGYPILNDLQVQTSGG